jgi:hypothetical protein
VTEQLRTIAIVLPWPHEGIVGTSWPVEGVGTFVCHPGKVEVINGVQVKYPPEWVREQGNAN